MQVTFVSHNLLVCQSPSGEHSFHEINFKLIPKGWTSKTSLLPIFHKPTKDYSVQGFSFIQSNSNQAMPASMTVDHTWRMHLAGTINVHLIP